MPLIAYKPGACAKCRRPIEAGATFAWGIERGTRVHVDCTAVVPSTIAEIDFTGLDAANTATAPAIVDTRVWSAYQEAIFRFGTEDTRSGIIYGVAGCAKTSSLEEMARRMAVAQPSTRIKYLVFNKRNASEAQERMPSNVDASTFHSSCWAAVSAHLHRPALDKDGNKVYNIGKQLVRPEMWGKHGTNLVRLVGLGKNSGLGALPHAAKIGNLQAWANIIEEYGIEFDLDGDDDGATIHEITHYAAEILTASNADTRNVDFDDMLYFPILLDIPLSQFPVVCVDESQDTNSIQRAILHKVLAPGGRLIAVGDPRQAIYHFRGASADAMERIAREFDCTELPLSINYRCSRAVVDEAKRFCPQIEAWDGAPAGSVETLTELSLADLLPTDAILCRLNAPLIQMAMRLLGAGVPCKVLGRDIGQSLISLIEKVTKKRTASLADLETALNAYETIEAGRFARRNQAAQAEAVRDRVASLFAVINSLDEEATSVDLIDKIRSMFDDTAPRGMITLATVHKAKGLEWARVFILNRQSAMPSKWAKLPAQIEQEQNLIYVAYTRAKVDLRFIEMGAIL